MAPLSEVMCAGCGVDRVLRWPGLDFPHPAAFAVAEFARKRLLARALIIGLHILPYATGKIVNVSVFTHGEVALCPYTGRKFRAP